MPMYRVVPITKRENLEPYHYVLVYNLVFIRTFNLNCDLAHVGIGFGFFKKMFRQLPFSNMSTRNLSSLEL